MKRRQITICLTIEIKKNNYSVIQMSVLFMAMYFDVDELKNALKKFKNKFPDSENLSCLQLLPELCLEETILCLFFRKNLNLTKKVQKFKYLSF